MSLLDLNTFSIAARQRVEGAWAFGVAVSTARPCVGALVPFVGPAGAIATQARTNTDLGRRGLELLGAGVPVAAALGTLLGADEGAPIRQLHGVDAGEHGTGVFAHTGAECVPWAGHRIGDGFTVAGNMLAGAGVVDAMVTAFGEELAERLVRALEAGQAAGGDKRGKQSAALLVSSPSARLYHNLRVDDHATPVAELRRLLELTRAETAKIREQYGEEGVRLFSRVRL